MTFTFSHWHDFSMSGNEVTEANKILALPSWGSIVWEVLTKRSLIQPDVPCICSNEGQAWCSSIPGKNFTNHTHSLECISPSHGQSKMGGEAPKRDGF